MLSVSRFTWHVVKSPCYKGLSPVHWDRDNLVVPFLQPYGASKIAACHQTPPLWSR